jgi:hypothetical protein
MCFLPNRSVAKVDEDGLGLQTSGFRLKNQIYLFSSFYRCFLPHVSVAGRGEPKTPQPGFAGAEALARGNPRSEVSPSKAFDFSSVPPPMAFVLSLVSHQGLLERFPHLSSNHSFYLLTSNPGPVLARTKKEDCFSPKPGYIRVRSYNVALQVFLH